MAYVYRADQVGGLVSPVSLTADAETEDAAVAAVLAIQKEVGIGVFTDGGLRRATPGSIFVGAVSGVQVEGGPGAKPYVAGQLVRTARLISNEVEFLKKHVSKAFKVCLPSPCAAAIALMHAGEKSTFYPQPGDVAAALVEILRQEVADLIADGVSYIQLDCPSYGRAANEFGFESAEHMLALDAAVFSSLTKSGDVSLAVHLPRSGVASDVQARVLELAFVTLLADRFLIEFDNNPQVMDFAPLRSLPGKAIAVLGLVDSLAPRAGEVDPLLDKIDQAGEFVSTDRLALSPQRSFVVQAGMSLEQQVKAQRTALLLTVDATHRYWGAEL